MEQRRRGEEGPAEGTTETRREPDDLINDLSRRVIGAAIEVHRRLGPGFLERVYEEALAVELGLRGIRFNRQVSAHIEYKGVRVGENRLDILVEKELVLELKATDRVVDVHKAQVMSYLKAHGLRLGLLLNFNVPVMRLGVQRVLSHQVLKRGPF